MVIIEISRNVLNSWIKEFDTFGYSAVYGELITFILSVVWFYGFLLFSAKVYKFKVGAT